MMSSNSDIYYDPIVNCWCAEICTADHPLYRHTPAVPPEAINVDDRGDWDLTDELPPRWLISEQRLVSLTSCKNDQYH